LFAAHGPVGRPSVSAFLGLPHFAARAELSGIKEWSSWQNLQRTPIRHRAETNP